MKEKILITMAGVEAGEELSRSLAKEYDVALAPDTESALKCLSEGGVAVSLVGLSGDGASSAIELVKEGRLKSPSTVFLVISSEASVESAVEAIRHGAYNFLKSSVSPDDILIHIKEALEQHGLLGEGAKTKSAAGSKYSDNIIGKSGPIEEIFQLVGKVADSDSNILILGESGTGKELIAKTIHYSSARRSEPFIPVNCGAIPAELLESELFGHEKGAFTGAISSRPGRFERADGGTIFLDEIGELAFPLQVKLLRVLQERSFERVGGNKTLEVDVRIIAATNMDLEAAVKDRRFREDLYYRLNVIPLNVPPLRDRKVDIPLLAEHFLKRLVERKALNIKGFEKDAMKLLKEYQWPGNIRELENIIERIVILKHGDGQIVVEDIPEKIKGGDGGESVDLDIPDEGVELNKILDELERSFILKAMKKSGGVKSKAAELLGINRTTLIEKMKKRGMLSAASKPNDDKVKTASS